MPSLRFYLLLWDESLFPFHPSLCVKQVGTDDVVLLATGLKYQLHMLKTFCGKNVVQLQSTVLREMLNITCDIGKR